MTEMTASAALALSYAAALQRLAEIKDQRTSGIAKISKGDEMVVSAGATS